MPGTSSASMTLPRVGSGDAHISVMNERVNEIRHAVHILCSFFFKVFISGPQLVEVF